MVELNLSRYQRLGLATAGVLLGMSAGMGLVNHVHADTTTPPTSSTIAPTVPTKGDSNSQGNNSQSGSSSDQTFQQQVDKTKDQNDSSSTNDQGRPADTYKMTIDVETEDGTKMPPYDPSSRPDKALAVQMATAPNYKAGDSYDFRALSPSTSTDYDVIKIVDDKGNTVPAAGKMPAHDLHVHIIIAPTGDRTVENDSFHQALVEYTKKHGLPKHILHQAYGGMSQEQVDEDAKRQEQADKDITDGKNTDNNNTSDDNSNTSDNGNSSDNTHTSDSIDVNHNNGSTNSGKTDNGNKKKVTLTFRIMYNGTMFGKETLSNLTPGSHYSDAKLSALQSELKKRGLSLTEGSLRLISGTVPDESKTIDLNVVKADGKTGSSGQGKSVNNAVKGSLGSDGTSTTNGGSSNSGATGDNGSGAGSNGGSQISNAPGGNNTLSPYGGSTKGDGTGGADNGSTDGQGNQSTLPQTGSISPVEQAGLIMLGVASLGLGGALLRRRQ